MKRSALKPELNQGYIADILQQLLGTPSPSGYCKTIMELLRKEAAKLGFSLRLTPKGNGIIVIKGDEPQERVQAAEQAEQEGQAEQAVQEERAEPTEQAEPAEQVERNSRIPAGREGALGIAVHVDTLGAMVRSIKPNGMLRFTPIGGYAMQSVEGEYCLVHTRDGRRYEGTVLSTKPSVHVYPDAREQKREEAAMEIRLDELVAGKSDVEALGIGVGD